MSAREMYIGRGWEKRNSSWIATSPGLFTPDAAHPVRVLVQEIPEGMPEFKPGDRVRWGSGYKAAVIGHPVLDNNAVWRMAVHPTHCEPMLMRCESCTLIPRETSRLIRVTGPERGVNETVQILHNRKDAAILTRVEVVDE